MEYNLTALGLVAYPLCGAPGRQIAYASQADITTLYGADLLAIVGDRNGDGVIDTTAVAAALEIATSEIETYLAGRYRVPLSVVPPYIRQLCIDIAVYRLAHSDAPRTEEMRRRYDDAIRFLTAFAKGTVEIPGLDQGGGEDDGTESEAVGGGAKIIVLRRC